MDSERERERERERRKERERERQKDRETNVSENNIVLTRPKICLRSVDD